MRKNRKFTQLELAKRLCVSQEAVSRYEAGKSLPTAENIVLLTQVLNVSADYLLGLSESEQLSMSPREQLSSLEWEMLYNFRRLSSKLKERAIGYIQGAADHQ